MAHLISKPVYDPLQIKNYKIPECYKEKYPKSFLREKIKFTQEEMRI